MNADGLGSRPAAGRVSAGAPGTRRPAGRVVAGIDDSPGGIAAVRFAVDLARSKGMPLLAVRCWALGLPRHGGRSHQHHEPHPHVILYLDPTEDRKEAAQIVHETFRAAGGWPPRDVEVTIETPEGEPGPTLTRIASGDGDLLVVGLEHGQAVQHLVHGSVSGYCLEHARGPVFAVPAPDDAGEADD